MKKTISQSTGTTLNSYIAQSGICSRRKAVELINAGEIKVNNEIMKDPSYRVQASDLVTYKDKLLTIQAKIYILLNKPKHYITTVSDEKNRKTVMDLVSHHTDDRLYPVGRLDRATTGLLLLTNDGQFAQKLAHPRYNVPKVYIVTLDKAVTQKDFSLIKNGLELEDGFIAPHSIGYASKDRKHIEIEIRSGRNRIVRRIFEALKYEVLKLDRVQYAFLTKKNLPVGASRLLTPHEILQLSNKSE